ncbi:hypothetical protein FACS189434_07010 [Bacteroidia bacterium]|nr:hypothetical protein FACS189434_07010 [Bacteroidia bacterium]
MKKIITTLLLLTTITLSCYSQSRSYNQELYETFTPTIKETGETAAKALVDGMFESDYLSEEYKYMGFGLGYGQSYGGMGAKMFWRFSRRIIAFGLGVGYGYNPAGRNSAQNMSDAWFMSFGMQCYIYNFYLDFQIGQIWKVNNINEWGCAFLLGYNWYFSKHWGINLALGYGEPFDVEKKVLDKYKYKGFIAEGGLLVRF